MEGGGVHQSSGEGVSPGMEAQWLVIIVGYLTSDYRVDRGYRVLR